MTESDRGLPARWFEEVWNKQNRAAIAEMLGPDAVLHEGEADIRGPEGFYPFFDRLSSAFSEIHVTVHDSFAEGDRVCVRWTFRGRHTGDAMGVPASGKVVQATGISIVRIAHGQMAEGWQEWDMLGMLEQIRASGKVATTYAAAR